MSVHGTRSEADPADCLQFLHNSGTAEVVCVLVGNRQAVMTRRWDEKSKMKIWRCATQGALCQAPYRAGQREEIVDEKKINPYQPLGGGGGIGKVKFGEVMWSFIPSS